jgi:sulfur relay (sulfurtransferase) DsrC/TusE family protein
MAKKEVVFRKECNLLIEEVNLSTELYKKTFKKDWIHKLALKVVYDRLWRIKSPNYCGLISESALKWPSSARVQDHALGRLNSSLKIVHMIMANDDHENIIAFMRRAVTTIRVTKDENMMLKKIQKQHGNMTIQHYESVCGPLRWLSKRARKHKARLATDREKKKLFG